MPVIQVSTGFPDNEVHEVKTEKMDGPAAKVNKVHEVVKVPLVMQVITVLEVHQASQVNLEMLLVLI